MTLQGGHLLVTQCRVENENFTDLDPTVGRYAVLVPGPDDEIAGGRGDRVPVVDLVFLVAIRPLGPFEGRLSHRPNVSLSIDRGTAPLAVVPRGSTDREGSEVGVVLAELPAYVVLAPFRDDGTPVGKGIPLRHHENGGILPKVESRGVSDPQVLGLPIELDR